MNPDQRSSWDAVRQMMGDHQVLLSVDDSVCFEKKPEDFIADLALYKFASKLIGKNKFVLDYGFESSLGPWILAKECGKCTGYGSNLSEVERGGRNWPVENVHFVSSEPPAEQFDTMTAFSPKECRALLEDKGRYSKALGFLKAHGTMLLRFDTKDFAPAKGRFESMNEGRGLFYFHSSGEIVQFGFSQHSDSTLVLVCK